MAGDGETQRWTVTWATSPMRGTVLPDRFDAGFHGQTVRQRVPITVGGTAVRLRLSNLFGVAPITFERVFVGIGDAAGGPGVAERSNTAVLFAGQHWVTVQPGADVVSDAVALPVGDDDDLIVSLFVPGSTGRPTRGLSGAVSWVVDGNCAHETGAGAEMLGDAAADFAWFLAAIDVVPTAPVGGAVVAIGDSLTAGGRASWPGVLRARLGSRPVVNVGIGGNRLLTTSPCFGTSGLARLGRDVFLQAGVETVVCMWSNDLGFHGATNESVDAIRRGTGLDVPFACFDPTHQGTAADVIAGYQQLIAQAHPRGLRVIGGTTPPFKGSFSWTPERGAARRQLNAWVLGSGAFDGTIDFAAALADCSDPDTLDPRFDRGDHLHHNEAGARAMAAAADLSLF